jgi:hypothetical protein
MFCYIANFILWITGVITDSIIFCFAFDAKNEEIKRWKLIAGLVAVRVPFTICKFFYNSNAGIRTLCIFVAMLGMIIYAHLLLKGYLWQKVLFVILEVVCSFFAEMCVQIIWNDKFAQYDTLSLDMPFMLQMNVYIYMFLTILYVMCLFLWRKVLRKAYDLRVFLLFSVFLVSQILLVSSINDKIYTGITASGVITICGFFIGILSDIMLLYILLKQQSMQEMKVRIVQMQMAWDAEHAHYEEIESRRNELAKIRHDLNDHFIVIKELLNSGENGKANEMLDTLIDYVMSTKEYAYCADPIVNAVLNENEMICKERGIAFTYGMQITAPLKLNPVVVCSIFSNLLKNAVAGATDALEDSQKAYIDVKSQADDAYLHVMVQNSYSTKKVKKKRKGYGQEILQKIADQNDGQMEIRKDNEIYEVSISVKMGE